MADVAVARGAIRPLRLELTTLICTVVLAIVGFCTVYPIVLVVVQSFLISDPGQPRVWGVDGWAAALSEPTLLSSLRNTVSLTFTRQALSLPIAIGIAWLLARTDVPARPWIEFGFWLAYFLPPLTVTTSWILLADPHFGLLNQVVGPLLGLKQGPFDVYSWWGIVWVEMATTAITIKVILLTPAFRYMNAAFEEASRVVGASTVGTLLRITVPMMTPVILVVTLVGTMASLQSFEIEQVLGAPTRLFVFSTMIYNLVQSNHPTYAPATALAVLVLIGMLPLVVLQQRATRNRQYTTVTGQFKNQIVRIGPWRWVVFGAIAAVLVVVLGVPIIFSVVGTFMTVFGFFNVQQPWTLANWQMALTDRIFLRSLTNTLQLAIGSAVVAVLVYSAVAYTSVRVRYRFRRALDFVSWLPATIPGIILSLALLWLFLQTPFFRPLYGTVGILILAGTLTGMPLGVQIIKSSLLQLGAELEEASRVAGASWARTYRQIVLRLLGPALLTVGLIVFVGAARNIGTIALLATSSNQPLSILQLNYLAQGRGEVAAVIAFIIMLTSIGGALLARSIGFKGAAL
jgi:iron(III) transport system permease protein